MSADGAAVVSGVDLALASWMDGPVLELSASVSGQRQRQRVGRCLCASEAAPPALKPTIKKPSADDGHIVPQVVQVPSAANRAPAHEPPDVRTIASNNGVATATTPAIKPILSRKNWSNTIETSTSGASIQHQASCLRRYDSQQSCKSAVTLRSYVSTQSRGKGQFGGRTTSGEQASGNSEVGEDGLSGALGANDDKFPGGPGLNERELWSLHRAVPGLRRHDPRTSTIRQHYYPEGGWGWLVVGAAFLVQVLTTGLQFAFGVMAAQISRHFRKETSNGVAVHMEAVWIGVIQLCGSWLWAPLVVALCRRKSTRLTAVLGGLVLALAALFASFAQQLHQVFLSYGALMSVAVALVREASALMVGQYFKRRRDFVEVVVQIGAGIGVILFAVFFKEALGHLGWRLGLQAATGLLLTAFFLGTFYRSASLYHPQRRAILHLKTQRKKVKVKGKPSNDRPPYFDFSVLRLKSLRMILLSSGIGAIGAYTPVFYLALQGEEDGLEASDLLLIHTFMGLAMAAGTVIVGLVVLRPSPQCLISLQYLCQVTLYGIGVSQLALASVNGYHGYVLFAWLYGFCLGGYQYALHQYTLDRVRARQFARGWSLVLAVRALPSLFGVPIAGYINQSTPRAGYYFSFTFTVIGASLLFLSKMYRRSSPPNLFLGRGRSSPPSFHRSSHDGAPNGSAKDPRVKCSQEPLLYRSETNGSVAAPIRTVHQDVCTCPHPQVPPPPPPPPSAPSSSSDDPLRLPKHIGRRIVRKLRLDSIPWKHNRFTEFLASHAGSATANGAPSHRFGAAKSTAASSGNAPVPGYAYDVDWEPDYWDNMGSCNDLDAECELCNTCADCGLPLDEDECSADDCHMHSAVLPDAVDIPELPPEVNKRYARSMREMSFSDPDQLQKTGTWAGRGGGGGGGGAYRYYDRQRSSAHIPKLPAKVLRRQHTWHDISALTRDVIEQITTSV